MNDPQDATLINDRPTLRDIRDTINKAMELIRETGYHDIVTVDGEDYMGSDIVAELEVAESALYLLEKSK